jgi:putative tributyrin esterase
MATFQMNYLSMKLGMQTNFTAILPDGPKGEKHKVLWLLHSDTGDDSELLKYTRILRYAERMNMAVVMPCGYNTMYSEDPFGQKFTELFTHEQRVICQNYFPISSRPEDNYIGGISLGAYGALKAALMNPELYSAAVIIDGGFGTDMKNGFLARICSNAEEEGLIAPYMLDDATDENIELYDAAVERVKSTDNPLKLFWAWGSENDVTREYSRTGAQALKELGFDVSDKEYEGYGRNWDFWDMALRDAVETWLPAHSHERGN